MSETPIRYPEPPDREKEQSAPLPPFEAPSEDEEPGEQPEDEQR